jgi:fido (protein-threonine AMPylation protein)
MLYSVPELDECERAVISAIQFIAQQLQLRNAPKWNGLLARQVFTPANDFPEPCQLTPGAAAYRETLADEQHSRALDSYRKATDYLLEQARVPSFTYTPEFLLALHGMMTQNDPLAGAGGWRRQQVLVLNVQGETVYEPPAASRVPGLIDELLDGLDQTDATMVIAEAAIAHLNLVRIHPFRDGSGRMARSLQMFILARGDLLIPEIANLEEYVGSNIRDYNDALTSTGRGWEPYRNVRNWLRFCLTAHYKQALGLLKKVLVVEQLRHESAGPRIGNLTETQTIILSEMFGVRPAVVERYWRISPGSVVKNLLQDTHRYGLRSLTNLGASQGLQSAGLGALLSPKLLETPDAPPCPFEILATVASNYPRCLTPVSAKNF